MAPPRLPIALDLPPFVSPSFQQKTTINTFVSKTQLFWFLKKYKKKCQLWAGM